MPHYDFNCSNCSERHEIYRPMSEAQEPSNCPDCGATMSRIWDAESVVLTYDLSPSWSEGHTIFQLPKNCPDRVVTSQKQMDKTYLKYGLDPDTHRPIEGQENKSGAHNFKRKKA
jgi:putative FmdB family regulatory protein